MTTMICDVATTSGKSDTVFIGKISWSQASTVLHLTASAPTVFSSSAKGMTTSVIKKNILWLVTKTPGIDDVEIAEKIGISPFKASMLLRKMEDDGVIFAE